MGTRELGLTPMKFSLHGLHSVKMYDERHGQLGDLLGLVLALPRMEMLLQCRVMLCTLRSGVHMVSVNLPSKFGEAVIPTHGGGGGGCTEVRVITCPRACGENMTGRERVAETCVPSPLPQNHITKLRRLLREPKATRVALQWPKATTDATGRVYSLNRPWGRKY